MTQPSRTGPAASPWGEPAPPVAPVRRPASREAPGAARSGPVRWATRRRPAPPATRWGRIRAAIVLIVIAVSIGVSIALALSLVVWGIATAIHHAANN